MVDGSDVRSPVAFSIVGVGASAGGLEAFTQLLRHLPVDTGLALVLIQHLDRTHPSLLSESLAKATAMPVHEAEQGARVEPNHVYVIPPNANITIHEGQLVLSRRSTADAPSRNLPIDAFLRSLADELGSHAIGVILSGSASDGTDGLRAIRAQGGITLAQDPRSAKFPGMPQSAVDAGVVDYCKDIPQLASELVRLSHHPYVRGQPVAPEATADNDSTRREIFALVRAVVGIDFSEFKASTVMRRMTRRMALRGVVDLRAYLALLQAEPAEIRALYEETLIHVTSFFRDPEVFEAVCAQVVPAVLKDKPAGAAMRVWVAGCSTGEEVYSLAIALLELSVLLPGMHPIQIFGSDVSELAIRKARAGMYTESAMLGVSEERRARYFTRVDGGYRISSRVRELCVFVRHDLVSDPPFSKLDLVSCRNVLIYFEPVLQKKVLPILHYSLNRPGFLLLGRSESISDLTQLFLTTDKANRIFARTDAVSGLRFTPRTETVPTADRSTERFRRGLPERSEVFAKHLDRLLLARYCPPAVLVKENLDVLFFRGSTGAYLQPAPGQPQNNLISMARGGLTSVLRNTIALAKRDMVVVRQADVEVDQEGSSKKCDVVVVPFSGIPESKEQLFIVLFEDAARGVAQGAPVDRLSDTNGTTDAAVDARRRARLEHELAATKEYLHSLVEEHGRANDELGVSNEELISGNEELQSLNEELETAKEELQSINEELTTLNDELRLRNQEVERLAAEAQKARGEAEIANHAKDDFLATLSHELRTPLASMLLHAQRLRSGTVVDPTELQRAGEALERAVGTQAGLIDDLLDVSRIVAGKLVLDVRPVDLSSAVQTALDDVEALVLEKGLVLKTSLEPELDPILVDRTRVQQVVANLLTNAIKFTPQGGEISVTVEASGGFARLLVTDTGIGIAPGFLPHVFTRFSQSDTSITRKYGGLGLGLALVRHLVELQGGTVRAESAGSGQGATFSVQFPMARIFDKSDTEPPPPRPPLRALDRPGGTKRYLALKDLRVLFVDDDEQTREAVREVLQHTGAQIELAGSAAAGRAAIETFKPQVILCDIAMPGEDGYTFIRRLRSHEATNPNRGAGIPALAFTALATEGDRARARSAGFQLHLAKPIDIDRLRDAVLELANLTSVPNGV